jgi:hypothetical protein
MDIAPGKAARLVRMCSANQSTFFRLVPTTLMTIPIIVNNAICELGVIGSIISYM